MADPVIPATDTVNYVFGFANSAVALQDPVIGTFTGQEVLLYFPSQGSAEPMSGYQPMVSQNGPVNDVLYDHPALLFALDLALPARGTSAILKTTLTAAQMAEMMMVLSNYGTIITAGLT